MVPKVRTWLKSLSIIVSKLHTILARIFFPALIIIKKPSSREMSARGYALYSVCPHLSFFLPSITRFRPNSLSLNLTDVQLLMPSCGDSPTFTTPLVAPLFSLQGRNYRRMQSVRNPTFFTGSPFL